MKFKSLTTSLAATIGALALSLTVAGHLPHTGNPALQGDTFETAQTNGMNRRDDRRDTRQDRRDDRQDCRQDEGVVGSDKRNCKQDARQGNDAEPTTQTNEGN